MPDRILQVESRVGGLGIVCFYNRIVVLLRYGTFPCGSSEGIACKYPANHLSISPGICFISYSFSGTTEALNFEREISPDSKTRQHVSPPLPQISAVAKVKMLALGPRLTARRHFIHFRSSTALNHLFLAATVLDTIQVINAISLGYEAFSG